MDSVNTVIRAVKQGDWAMSLDLKDAYLHVPIFPGHKKYLRFALGPHEHFQFRCLCFGLSTAPRTFTKVVVALGALMRMFLVRVYQYLDDWIVIGKSRQEVLEARSLVLRLTQEAGFVINFEKSHLTPAQEFVYLGVLFPLDQGVVQVTKVRFQKILEAIHEIKKGKWANAGVFLSLIGLLTSCVEVGMWTRLHVRPVQFHLMFHWKMSSRNLLAKIPISPELIHHLGWWKIESNVREGVPLQFPKTKWVLETDASMSG